MAVVHYSLYNSSNRNPQLSVISHQSSATSSQRQWQRRCAVRHGEPREIWVQNGDGWILQAWRCRMCARERASRGRQRQCRES
eukprot:scaffold3917_cov113-Isochrysis_galbana.AAC.2